VRLRDGMVMLTIGMAVESISDGDESNDEAKQVVRLRSRRQSNARMVMMMADSIHADLCRRH